jgi:hypothetical protein
MGIEEDVNGWKQLPHRRTIQAVYNTHIVGAVRFVRMRQTEVEKAAKYNPMLTIFCVFHRMPAFN